MLFSVRGDVRRPGVYERPEGITVRALLEDAGGPPPGQHWIGVLPGGYSMPPLLGHQLDVPLRNRDLNALGTGLGASIIALGSGRSFSLVGYEIMAFFARETCAKCPVCVKGSQALRDGFEPYVDQAPSDEDQAALLLLARKYRKKGI